MPTAKLTMRTVKLVAPPVEQARDLARIKLGAVAAGEDPTERVQLDRSGMTVSDLCGWYLKEAEMGRLQGRRRRPVAATTLALDRSRIKQHVKPLIGNRLVQKLSIAELERFRAIRHCESQG